MKIALFTLLTVSSLGALASEATPGLPPEPLVARLLVEAPMVRAASAQLRAEEANKTRLEAGPHEWNARVGGQQRRTLPNNAPDERYSEWSAALERPLRLPGKGALDAEIGAAGVQIAQTGLGDARHETARALLAAWFAWLREQATAQQWAQQVELLARQEQAVQRRRQLGDAARIETVQAAAALAQAEAQLGSARAREAAAQATLQRRFPGLPQEAPPLPDDLPPLADDAEAWTTAILAENHELAIARGEARRGELLADRAGRERLPDPTVGLQYSRERNGEEKVLGAYLSIPLPGQARRAAADSGRAQAEAAGERARAIEQRLAGEASALYQATRAALPAWQAARQAATHLQRSADMQARAYQLGEGSLNELLNARRLAHEGSLSAALARLEALELRYRLLLDAHRIWDFD